MSADPYNYEFHIIQENDLPKQTQPSTPMRLIYPLAQEVDCSMDHIPITAHSSFQLNFRGALKSQRAFSLAAMNSCIEALKVYFTAALADYFSAMQLTHCDARGAEVVLSSCYYAPYSVEIAQADVYSFIFTDTDIKSDALDFKIMGTFALNLLVAQQDLSAGNIQFNSGAIRCAVMRGTAMTLSYEDT